ncbi:MFS transporter [Streptomyces luteolus]|uniref:MFS transporter n=1 Tax=Streptomyces luteolus TaxID=3043615 RepID=A0ABT6SQ51_9ACTN|nr:MFS transporter [Streptomyces sp. B-S-A12]MDI3417742.1 MFS transporter [Streptomyces sp. B-S-A12]
MGASTATGALSSLRNSPPFRRLWVSNLFFFCGTWTQTLILGWLVFESTHSEILLAVFTSARLAPMLLGPFAGVLSDRLDRVRLLTFACTWALVAVAAVATMESFFRVPYWALVLGGLAIGLAQSPSQPARFALVLDLVGRESLSNANALNAMAMNMTQVLGPAIGGAMISAVGAPAALWISTAWYGISLIALRPLRHRTRRTPHATARRHPESVGRMLTAGLRTVLTNRLAAGVLFVTLAANILLWPVYQGFMPVFADELLHLDAAGLGWLLTCGGAGGLAGSLIIAGLGDFRAKGGLFVIGTATWAALWALFALSHHTALSFVLMACIGLTSATFGVLQSTLLLMVTEPSVQGRALGIQELAIGVMPLASLVLGVAAQQVGVGTTTFVSAMLLVVFLSVLAFRVPQLLRYSGREDTRV